MRKNRRELAELDDETKAEMLADLGMDEPALHKVTRAAYALLGLQSYFTAGERKSGPGPFRSEPPPPQAAGVIHTDFERGFIRAEIVSSLTTSNFMTTKRAFGKPANSEAKEKPTWCQTATSSTSSSMSEDPSQTSDASTVNVFNHVAGGVLMGLANLVPGISGGTMLLAAGVYRSLIEAVGQLCRFNITKRNLFPLVWIAIPAAVTIVSLAGTVSGLVQNHRPLAYATFIGLTLGGVPLLLRQLPQWTAGAKGGVVFGVMAMGGIRHP